ncbi:Centrin-1 [Quaeritorhiza haematococci]|nr:Centrin-1 [Quaeritorhiza haematococci]
MSGLAGSVSGRKIASTSLSGTNGINLTLKPPLQPIPTGSQMSDNGVADNTPGSRNGDMLRQSRSKMMPKQLSGTISLRPTATDAISGTIPLPKAPVPTTAPAITTPATIQSAPNSFFLAQRNTKFDLTPDQQRDIKEAFGLFDTDGSGAITAKEWRIAMKALGFEPSREDVKRLMAVLDADGSGTIEYTEFLNVIRRKMWEKLARDEMRRAFRLYDTQRKGIITIADVKTAAETVGEYITDEELHEMMDEADRNDDKTVSEEEFVRLMKKTV